MPPRKRPASSPKPPAKRDRTQTSLGWQTQKASAAKSKVKPACKIKPSAAGSMLTPDDAGLGSIYGRGDGLDDSDTENRLGPSSSRAPTLEEIADHQCHSSRKSDMGRLAMSDATNNDQTAAADTHEGEDGQVCDPLSGGSSNADQASMLAEAVLATETARAPPAPVADQNGVAPQTMQPPASASPACPSGPPGTLTENGCSLSKAASKCDTFVPDARADVDDSDTLERPLADEHPELTPCHEDEPAGPASPTAVSITDQTDQVRHAFGSQSLASTNVDGTMESGRQIDLSQHSIATDTSGVDVASQDSVNLSVVSNFQKTRLDRLGHLKHLFGFPTYLLSTLLRTQGMCNDRSHAAPVVQASVTGAGKSWLRKLLGKTSSLRLSTSFSGIDTPNVAMLMLTHGICQLLGRPATKADYPHNVWACEKYSQSQAELAHAPNHPGCLFGDMCDFFHPVVKAKLESMKASNHIVSALEPMIESGTSAVVDTAWCYTCGKMRRAEPCDLHVAGTPCVAFSTRGSRNQFLDPSYIPFLSWVGQRKLLMEKIILQENVSQFPSSKISQLLGCLYHIDHAVLCPSELGWPVTRPRKWHVLRHRYKTGAFASPLNMFTRIFCRPPSWHNDLVPHWDILFAANINDLMDEIAWASRRPESSARDMANPDVLKDDWNSMTPDGAYYQSLTKFEQANLQNYIQKQPQQAYSLNQNSNVQPTVSRWDVLRTLTKNGGILWSDVHHRWLAARESLLCQGFPAYPELSDGIPLTGFALDAWSMWNTSRTAVTGQAGNAMHTEVCSIMMLFCVTQVIDAQASVSSSSAVAARLMSF